MRWDAHKINNKMKLTTTNTQNDDYETTFEIAVDGKIEFSVSEGSPEDNSLGRNFSDCFNIPDLMRMAYDAGRRGEEFTVHEAVAG